MSEPIVNITINDDTEPSLFDLGGGVIVSIVDAKRGWVRHPCPPGYWRPAHDVDIDFVAKHTLISRRPLTITPSLHCDPAEGGCGWHVFITDGKVQ